MLIALYFKFDLNRNVHISHRLDSILHQITKSHKIRLLLMSLFYIWDVLCLVSFDIDTKSIKLKLLQSTILTLFTPDQWGSGLTQSLRWNLNGLKAPPSESAVPAPPTFFNVCWAPITTDTSVKHQKRDQSDLSQTLVLYKEGDIINECENRDGMLRSPFLHIPYGTAAASPVCHCGFHFTLLAMLSELSGLFHQIHQSGEHGDVTRLKAHLLDLRHNGTEQRERENDWDAPEIAVAFIRWMLE